LATAAFAVYRERLVKAGAGAVIDGSKKLPDRLRH